MVIQIQISDNLWEYLHREKKRGESFDEVLLRKLNKEGTKNDKNKSMA